jgi:hypothetical protein
MNEFSKVDAVYVEVEFSDKKITGYRVKARCRDMFYGTDSFDYFYLSHFALFSNYAQAEALVGRIEAAMKNGKKLDSKHWLGGDWSEAVLETVPRK